MTEYYAENLIVATDCFKLLKNNKLEEWKNYGGSPNDQKKDY